MQECGWRPCLCYLAGIGWIPGGALVRNPPYHGTGLPSIPSDFPGHLAICFGQPYHSIAKGWVAPCVTMALAWFPCLSMPVKKFCHPIGLTFCSQHRELLLATLAQLPPPYLQKLKLGTPNEQHGYSDFIEPFLFETIMILLKIISWCGYSIAMAISSFYTPWVC